MFQFGFEMGTGVRTYLPSTTPYVVVMVLLLFAFPAGVSIVAASSFGAGRGLLMFARLMSSARDQWDTQLRRRSERGILIPLVVLLAVSFGLAYG